jgi:hypothetical protein
MWELLAGLAMKLRDQQLAEESQDKQLAIAKAQGPQADPSTAAPDPGGMSLGGAGGAGSTQINQSVPQGSPEELALLDYLSPSPGSNRDTQMRKQSSADMLREYGGGQAPPMRLGQAPSPWETASVLGNRLATQYSTVGARDAKNAGIEDLLKKVYAGQKGSTGASPKLDMSSYPGMDTSNYSTDYAGGGV